MNKRPFNSFQLPRVAITCIILVLALLLSLTGGAVGYLLACSFGGDSPNIQEEMANNLPEQSLAKDPFVYFSDDLVFPAAQASLQFVVSGSNVSVRMNGRFYYSTPAEQKLQSVEIEQSQYDLAHDHFFIFNKTNKVFQIVSWNDISLVQEDAVVLFYNHLGTINGSWKQLFTQQQLSQISGGCSCDNTDNPAIVSTSRLGFNVYDSGSPPQQSVQSYLMAYSTGFDAFVCDLRFTTDNVPVLHHDDDISSYGRTLEGEPIPAGEVLISESTYQELLQYDYGIYKGAQYAGTPIMTLSDMFILAKQLGVEVIVELKTGITQKQTQQVCQMIQRMGMEDLVVWSIDNPEQGQFINQYLPNCRIALETNLFATYYEDFLKMKTDSNTLFVRFPHDINGLMLEDYIDSFIENDIKFSIGTIDSTAELDAWFARGDIYWSVNAVRSNILNVEQYFHQKSHNP